MDDDARREELAKQRWAALQMVRLGAAATVLLGVVVMSGRLIDVPEIGYALLLAGAAGFFLVPKMLAKNWRSPNA